MNSKVYRRQFKQISRRRDFALTKDSIVPERFSFRESWAAIRRPNERQRYWGFAGGLCFAYAYALWKARES